MEGDVAPVGGMTEAVAAAKARVRGPTVTERREAEQQASAAAVQTKSKKRKEPPAADDVAEATGGCVRSDAARRGRVHSNAAPVNVTAYAEKGTATGHGKHKHMRRHTRAHRRTVGKQNACSAAERSAERRRRSGR